MYAIDMASDDVLYIPGFIQLTLRILPWQFEGM
jgi:hypothetical protein